ncbi:MAG: fumarylacetoacetate hydrolase family protein [Planctomycetaceae bacterium]|nr:fumarylacetoacetate hydrolase family protein [Planctomycetaceae bacterium]
MRLVSYLSSTGPRVAGVRQGQFVDLNANDPALPSTMEALLAAGAEALTRAAEVTAKGKPLDGEVQLLAPVPRPGKVLCVGLNYADHARESGQQPPPEPVLFNKLLTAVSAPGAPIVVPRISQEVDYEAELVVVIGRQGRYIPEADALDYVAGYTVGNDVSARDWQLRKPGGQWLLGKTFDGFAPFGPHLVTADEVGNPGKLRIQLRLNGQTMQDSTTEQLIFSIDKLVAYVSQVCTLLPGDIIFTGTPPGVGAARKPPVFLKPGDVVEVEIEKLGVLRNPVVAEAAR